MKKKCDEQIYNTHTQEYIYKCMCVRLCVKWFPLSPIYGFANGPGDLGSIPDRVIPKTLKTVLDIFLHNTQQYKVSIKGKVEQSREMSSALPYTLV